MKDDVDPQVKHFHISRVSRSVGACAERGDVAAVRSVREIDDGAYNIVVMEADNIGEDTLVLSLLITSGPR